jgi:hypothetical protein
MPRIVTALFKDRAQAQQGLQALMAAGVAQSRITTIGLNEGGRDVSSISGFRTLDIPPESHAALRELELPEDDRSLFEQGLQRGRFLIAARIDRENLDEAIRILEMFDPVDLDRESREWAAGDSAAQGGGAAQGSGGGVDVGGPLGAGLTAGVSAGTTNTGSLPGAGLMGEAADDLGSADLRADETAQPASGESTTTGTGARRGDARADREGVNELAGSGPAPVQAGLVERHMHRGRVRVFGSD